MTNGSVTLNGVTEPQFAKVLEFKVKHGGKFTFDAGGARQNQITSPTQTVTYNQVILGWNDDAGLKIVLELVGSLVA